MTVAGQAVVNYTYDEGNHWAVAEKAVRAGGRKDPLRVTPGGLPGASAGSSTAFEGLRRGSSGCLRGWIFCSFYRTISSSAPPAGFARGAWAAAAGGCDLCHDPRNFTADWPLLRGIALGGGVR